MKIDKTRLKKSTSEVPSECQNLIDKLRACSRDELHAELSKVETWTFGKCELYHWIDILDKFDSILEDASICPPQHKFYITCDTSFDEEDQNLLLLVLHFTTLLIEHSFSRHLYNSMEHLITLLSSSNMRVVLGVLNLLYMFSKRSNFITRLNSEKRQALLCRLNFLAETWGGNDYGFGLADCCKADQVVPRTASTLYYEYFGQDGNWSWIHIKDIHLVNPPITPAEYMSNIIEERKDLSEEKLLHVFTRLRLAASFHKYSARLQFVQARLQALSVLVYANALQESAHTLLYPGLLDELVELLELQQSHLVEIRAAALRTLTSIIHLDRNPHFPKKPGSRLNLIIGVTGAASYHGFLPVLVRTCIATLTQPKQEEIDNMFPLPLATALFSFLYHLASYESGGEALVACGMMESLLRVINWPGNELEHITFVTRAVRVIDLITNIDMQAFHTHGGINSFISRLHMEVNLCRREQQYEIVLQSDELGCDDFGENEPAPSTSKDKATAATTDLKNAKNGCTCLPQRAALLKSMLNFLKKAIQDSAFSDSIRHVMEGTLPSSLKHIISNAEYYGPSLFLLATDVVTVYVFQEPSHLSSLQDNGLTEVLLHALLIKDVPATREVLGSLPNVFSALCLNARGLVSFVKYKPFERLFKVLLSPVYLAAMRRRRNSHPMSDTASNLGNAMDELIRHQPSLKFDATEAIIRLLEDLVQLGTDPKYVCWRAQSKTDLSLSPPPAARPAGNNEAGSSDEDDEDEEEASTSSHTQRDDGHQDNSSQSLNEKTPIALVDYILNVMKFVDAILSNNSTDDHCRAFVVQGGLKPLLAIVGLPNLPVDCPITQAAQAVASVCKSVLNLGHEPQVLQIGLEHLLDLVQTMKPLYNHLTAPAGSVLLRELANAPNLETAFSTASATPLLHAMGAAHGYIVMFVHVCRTGRTEIRTMALQKWGQDTEYGRMLLYNLVRLYTALVWESTLLLALCSDDIIPAGCDFGKEDLDKLLPQDMRNDSEVPWSSTINQDSGSNGMTTAMEALSTNPSPVSMDVDTNQPLSLIERANESRLAATAQQLKYIRTLLGASSRLGRALAELFGLLVKLCVGSPIRQRRGQNIHPTPSLTIPASRDIARVLSYILVEGLAWEKLPVTPVPKFRLTFLICSVGFTSPMLFDEKRYAYHIMLQMFVDEGGQTAFFDTFRWALSAGGTIPLHKGLEHPDLPEGTGEFLDAWLLLLEKMVNPKSILDTPHLIPARARKNGEEFDPVKYLNQIHKQAFNTIMMMWGKKPLKTYGGRMSETMLSIIRHILRGEQIIAERTTNLVSEENSPGTSTNVEAPRSSTANSFQPSADVNADHLKQLMDMGFSKDHSTEALLHSANLEQATDYLLNNPPSTRGNSSMDLDLTEDYQMLRAIAMSLGDKSAEDTKDQEKGSSKKTIDDVPLTEDVINHFTKGALAACLNLLDTLPDTVYRVCVLLVTITKRNGTKWREDMLTALVAEISENVLYLISKTESDLPSSEIVNELTNSEAAAKAAVRIYLFTLLFEGAKIKDMRIPNTEVVQCSVVVPSLVKLLIQGEQCMTAAGNVQVMPKWLPPLLLLINLIEKVALIAQRQEEMELLTNPLWKSYDIVSGRWIPFTASNNKIINEAYHNGEDECRIVSGRQRYIISFRDFHQSELELGSNVRSIIRTPKCLCKDGTKSKESGDGKSGASSDSKSKETSIEEDTFKNRRRRPRNEYELLHQVESGKIVASCVRLMTMPVDRDTLHALMRICLRYTRDHENATIFAKEGGVKILLETTQGSSYTGFVNLATLLIRHIIEEPRTLWLAMENVVRICTMANVPPQFRDLFYLSTRLSSALSRNPEVYQQMAQSILRVDINVLNRRNPLSEDNRLLLKSIPSPPDDRPPLSEDSVAVRVIYDLLNALIKPTYCDSGQSSTASSSCNASPEKPISSANGNYSSRSTMSVNLSSQSTRLRRTPGHIDILRSSHDILRPENNDDDMPSTPILPLKSYRDTSHNGNKLADDEAKKPLLPKSAILKILAEAVRSYQTVATLITDYVYHVGQSEMITENTKALAFILDKLLPMVDNSVDRECCTTVRMLIASLASAHDSQLAQTAVVHEVKMALLRALAMPESVDKHNQLQLLTGLIPIMIENCPTENPSTIKVPYKRSDIFLIMLRKGLICDLARVPQYLDLSSPNMVATINATLKPLETLLRISNQPMHNSSKFKFKSPRKAQEEQGTSSSTTLGMPQLQGEEVGVEDGENNEHELVENADGLEAGSNNHVHGEVDTGLEEIMDQLLERDLDRNAYHQQVADNHNMEIVDEPPNIENIGYNPDRDATEDMMSSESGDSNEDSNGSEPEDREMDEDADENEDEAEIENDPYDYDDPFEFYDDEVVQSLFRMRPIDRENENILMIQYPDPDHEGEHENSRRNLSSVHWSSNGLTFPFGLLDDSSNTNDAVLPPPHPLLMARHNMDPANVSVSRTQRANRQRRYHYLQIPNNTRDQNPPVILQRLLGPDSQSMPRVLSGGGFRDSRLLVMDNGFGIFTNSREEESIDFVDQSGDLFGPSLSISMHTNPTALNWWNQEAALLDGDSGVNLVLIVCSNLISDLEKHRAAELAKARGKRRKKLFDDDDKQKSQDKDELNEAFRQMETEGENSQLLLDNQSSATASARALAHWALENTTDEDSLNPSRHLTLGFNPELFTEPVLIESSQYGAENTRPEIINENSLLDEEPFLVSSADLDSLNSATSHAAGPNPVTAPSIVTSAVLTSSSNVENTFSNAEVQDPLDLIVGITGSPSRQGVTQGSLISISSNSWAISQEGAGSSAGSAASTAENNSVALPSNPDAPPAAGSSSNTNDIPDWVDPSFLAALPDEMRAEVLAEQMRLQRIRVRAQTMTSDASPVGLAEVNPEFLAALPPAIQEEVLAQQRIEQQRQAAASANPNDPVDAAAFFQNLHPSLRQAILTDMEESQISVLPPELAAEAHNLRRDWESRNRQLMQERFLHQIGHSSNALSSILRSSRGIMGNHISNLHDRGGGPWSPWTRVDHTNGPHSAALALSTNMERTGRPLLDHESLACLLVLLFIDEPKFNTLRLHRVIRNLCSHVPTREWVIKSLLSIIERSNETNDPFPVRSMSSVERPQWLNISLDAALGCRANVFLMKRIITRRQKNSSPIAIHPQAASVVCKHTLELLISLAKSFPAYFLPMKLKSKKFSDWFTVPKDKEANKEQPDMISKSSNDFWDILVRLDSTSSSRKGKGVLRLPKDFVESSNANKSFEASPFGQLITMLSYNVIKRSSQLTDKLLRLLSLISSDLPVMHSCPFDKNKSEENEECVPESEEHLQLAIQVLTSKSCSEDGLEDATALLLNLSHFSFNTRRMILHLLLDGAIDLSVMVQLHISNLVKELKTMNNVNREIIKDDHGEGSKASKGTLKDRFTKDAVIVAAPSKTKATCDLQLPSMAPLISKTSSQAFFLRILKVIVQIREAVREESKNAHSKEGSSASVMFDEPPLATSETLDEVNATEPPIQNYNTPSSQDPANAMDTSVAVAETTVTENEEENDTPLLSEALDLQSLWNTLSQCLFELEETPDHHAVLVLQPAVEAFFLVHSSSQSKKNREQLSSINTNTTRESAGSVNLPANPSRNSGSVSPSLPVENNDVAPLSPLDGTSQGSESTNSSVLQLTAEPKTSTLNSDQKKFLAFAETHRTVLNQILRQTTTHLADGPFSVLVDHTRVLDFDVKRRYFRTELERLDEGVRREELAVHVRRSHIFEDSFRELYRRNPEEWKNRFYIVFEDEEGQDAGGLLREWYVIISRDIFNPMYALFTVSPGDRVTYMINSSSHCNPNHLCYYKFVGRVIAKAIYDNKLLECYFTRSFYKHILGIQVKHTDMESEDYSFYQGLVYLTEHNVSDLGYDLTFSAEVQEFGVTDVRDLIPNGRNIPVTEENKHEYIRRVCQMKMCGAIQQQLSAFLEGFYDIIPKRLISIFNEQELELLISGLPNVDIEDLKANTEYHKYQTTSIQIQWFWRSLRSFDQADRAKFLQFVTGTSKVPLQGFAALEGMNGVQKFQIHRDDRSTDRLPSAHTCFNQLDLPVYETYDKLRSNLMKAIHECSEGFGFA